jgi:KaiC/GvpD/RAD55 family RecA-like ATPase
VTLTPAEAEAAWENLAAKRYRHYRPLSEAAKQTISEAQDDHRVFTGFPQFDAEMRGIGRGHLLNVVGYAHSGKTLVLLRMLTANKDKRTAYFCPDETASLVLVKLTSILTGVGARDLERRVAAGDQEAIDLLYSTAEEHFPNLAVFEDGLTPRKMEEAYTELVNDVWDGKPADMVIVDYVDLLDECGDTPPLKFNFLKSFGKQKKVAMVLIHQTSRTAGAEGRSIGISSGNFGGEQHATFQIGVRRKESAIMSELGDLRSKATPNLERIRELEHDLLVHQYTITLNLNKNKRPGGAKVDDIDFELDVATGRLYDLAAGEMPRQWSRNHSLAAKEERGEQMADSRASSLADVIPINWQEQELGYEPF